MSSLSRTRDKEFVPSSFGNENIRTALAVNGGVDVAANDHNYVANKNESNVNNSGTVHQGPTADNVSGNGNQANKSGVKMPNIPWPLLRDSILTKTFS